MKAIIPVFFYTIALILFLIPIANKLGLVDTPNGRKQHLGSVPLVGGVAIYIATSSYFVIFLPLNQYIGLYLFAGSLLVLIGIIDDFFDIRVSYKLFVQFFCAFILVVFGKIYVENFGNLFSLGTIELGAVGAVLTVIFIVANINAYNMIDGIDGLLGILSLISFVTLAVLMSINSSSFAVIPIVISSTIIAYLLFNFSLLKVVPKIFIGDAGAMLLGFTICWLIIVGTVLENSFRPILALYIVGVPIFDLLFNVISRIKRSVSPVKPARDHVHHRLMQRGFSSKQTVTIIGLFAVLISALGIIGEVYQAPDYIMTIGIVVLYAFFSNHFSKTKSIQLQAKEKS